MIANEEIRFYRASGPYGFLSNLYPCPVEFEQRSFPHSEAAYQFGKPVDPRVAEWIAAAPEPTLCAQAAHSLFLWQVRPDWSHVRVTRMFDVVTAKFEQNTELRRKLLATGEAVLIEESSMDAFWGLGKRGTGKNMLGRLLTAIRFLAEREYSSDSDLLTFCKTKEAWGGLSNMASGFPLIINDIPWPSSEALYQACRYPDNPEWQRDILAASNGMMAKMASKRESRRAATRLDWEMQKETVTPGAKIAVMRWVLRVKLAQHFDTFAALLRETGNRTIVERSHKDRFWGAVPAKDQPGALYGANILGRLLCELRDELRNHGPQALQSVPPPDLPNFRLLGQEVRAVQP